LTLVRFGSLKTTSVSKLSKIARPDVYRTLSRLHELSLVEQIIGSPVNFKAIPLEKGVKLLLKSRGEQYEKLKKDSELLLTTFDAKEDTKEIRTADNLFILIPKKETVITKQIEAIEETQKSIDVVLSWNRFYRGQEIFDQYSKKAAGRKVHVRYIVENPPSEQLRDQALSSHESDFFKMHFLKDKPKAIFGIYDQKKVMLLVDPLFDAPGASPSLWTNNGSLVSLLQENFERLWQGTQ